MTRRSRPRAIRHEFYARGLHAYLIVTDPMAGSRGRYTTYRIELAGLGLVSIVGRELSLAHSRAIVKGVKYTPRG